MARTPFDRLRDLIRERQTLYDKYGNPRAFLLQPDRGAALLAHTDIDCALDDVLHSRMPHLNSNELGQLFTGVRAPLATYFEKMWVAYGMNLYGRKTWTELDRVNKIRNAFAHAKRPITFRTSQVSECCAWLTYVERVPRPHFSHFPKSKRWPPTSAKDRYLQTTKALATALAMLGQDNPDPDYPLD